MRSTRTSLSRGLVGGALALALAVSGSVTTAVVAPAEAQAADVWNCDVDANGTLTARFRLTRYSTGTSMTLQASYYNTSKYRIHPTQVVWNEVIGPNSFATKEKWWVGDTWNPQRIRTSGRTIDDAFVNVELVHRTTGATVHRSCFRAF
ncbi:hypothetical protein GCM10011512_13870 [Tersicoccus solisilvae]|uniref:Secreted protein n=1 Tax=Tersicoccus solisilvae TaxID=1882339 RepID=A0ABQ1NZA1_9MICC|nr:hypothetical protein [Tersicoccus solisilvae]GGC88157.1 hypothetical protein GCM10011512_13870 [Tersicoccus solisilvae]